VGGSTPTTSGSNAKNGKTPGPFDFLNQMNGPPTEINVIDPENIKEKFNNVAGLKNSKLEIMEFVEFLKNPDK